MNLHRLLLYALLINVVFAGNCTILPLWQYLDHCDSNDCYIMAEFPPVRTNCDLLFHDYSNTSIRFQYLDPFNRIIFRKQFEYVDPFITGKVTNYPITSLPGYYLDFDTSKHMAVLAVDAIVPTLGINLDGVNYNVSEISTSSFADISFFPRNVTFNATSFTVGDIFVVEFNASRSIHTVRRCPSANLQSSTANQIGAFRLATESTLVPINQTLLTSKIMSATGATPLASYGSYDLSNVHFGLSSEPHFLLMNNVVQENATFDINGCIVEFYNRTIVSHQSNCTYNVTFPFFDKGVLITPPESAFSLQHVEALFLNNTLIFDDPESINQVIEQPVYMYYPFTNGDPIRSVKFRIFLEYQNLISNCEASVAFIAPNGNILATVTDVGQTGVIETSALILRDTVTVRRFNFTNDRNFVTDYAGVSLIVPDPMYAGNESLRIGFVNNASTPAVAITCFNIPDVDNPQSITVTYGRRYNISSTGFVNVYIRELNGTKLLTITQTNSLSESTVQEYSQTITTFSNRSTELCFELTSASIGQSYVLVDYVYVTAIIHQEYGINGSRPFGFKVDTSSSDCMTSVKFTNVLTSFLYWNSMSNIIDVYTPYQNCTQVPFKLSGSHTSSIFQLVEPKYTDNSGVVNGSILFGELLSDFDPEISVGGMFVIENNNISSCFQIAKFDTEQKSKNDLYVHMTITNICNNVSSITYIVPNNDYFIVDNNCESEVDPYDCKIKLELITKEKFAITVIVSSETQNYQKQFIVEYDEWVDCKYFCDIPVLSDLSHTTKVVLVTLMTILTAVILFYASTPIIVFFIYIFSFVSVGYYITMYITTPFRKAARFVWNRFTGCCSRKYKEIKQRVNTSDRVSPADYDSDMNDYYSETDSFLPQRHNYSSFVSNRTRKMPMVFLFLFVGVNLIPKSFACDNEVLSATNITSCFNNACSTKLNVVYNLLPIKYADICLDITSVETNLGVQAVDTVNLNVTVLDFFIQYHPEWDNDVPWDTTFNTKSSCDCPDGSSHHCSASSHSSATDCNESYCIYKATTGTESNCQDLLLFGDGHYCTKFGLTYTDIVTVLHFDTVPTYHMNLQICKDDITGLECTTFWYNGTTATTLSLFDGLVTFKIDGYLFANTPTLQNYALIRSRSNAWLKTGVNRRGDYTLASPNFVQQFNGTWHMNNELYLSTVSMKHKECYPTTKVDISQNYPIFSKFLQQYDVASTVLSNFGQVFVSGYGINTQMLVRPYTGPSLEGLIQTSNGFVTVQVTSACPVISNINTTNFYQDSSASAIIVDLLSTCGTGEARTFINETEGLDVSEDCLSILSDQITTCSIKVVPRASTVSGQVCSEGYFTSVCKKFTFETGVKEITDGYISDTQHDVTEEDSSSADVCLLCWSDWISFDLVFDSALNIIKSLFMILVYCVIGILILYVLWKFLVYMAKKFAKKQK